MFICFLFVCVCVCVQVIEGEAVTGLELHQRISRAVHLLKSKGAAPGHRMLITMKPSVDFYALAIASFAIGMYGEMERERGFWKIH